MTANPSSTIIIGVGNPYRSDDGAGIEVARRLKVRVPAGVRILEESGEGAALLDAWQGAAAVIVADAVFSGAAPGTIHRLEPHKGQVPARFFHYSTHAFSLAEAVELARVLNQLPPCLIVYGIEGEKFAAGVGLSAAVEQAVDAVVAQILTDLRALLPDLPPERPRK